MESGDPMPQAHGPVARLTMPIGQLLFSFRGRIPRSIWWVAWSLSLLVCFLLLSVLRNAANASPELKTSLMTIGVAVLALLVWVNLALGAKRWHDTDRPGWFCLFPLIPYVGLIVFLVYGLSAGTSGPNTYGADPLFEPGNDQNQ
jgi:uncharacterized membrane protein YhaH (DUF805 family)